VGGESLISSVAEVVPDRFVLFQNYPNPFNPQTTIAFQLPERATTQLVVYNTLGQAVRTLVKDDLTPGEYRVTWDGKNDFDQQLPSGIYFYELKAKEISRIKKMILLH
jgi:flagellar hook assembly protein FlgD